MTLETGLNFRRGLRGANIKVHIALMGKRANFRREGAGVSNFQLISPLVETSQITGERGTLIRSIMK